MYGRLCFAAGHLESYMNDGRGNNNIPACRTQERGVS